jgi:hypothetical protein
MIDNLTQYCNDNRIIDPRTTNFEEIEIDEKIKHFVKTINKSNWLYTIWSCQGHLHTENTHTLPYFVFLVDNQKINQFLHLIYQTIPETKKEITKGLLGTSGEEITINKNDTGEYYSLISIYWSKQLIDNENFYQKLNQMAERINPLNKYLLPPT